MSPVTRRRSIALLVATIVPGCAGFPNPDRRDAVKIASLRLQNAHSERVAADILLLDGSTVAYWETHTLTAATEDQLGGKTVTTHPGSPGDYSIHVRVREMAHRARQDLVAVANERRSDCLGVEVQLGSTDSATPDPSLFFSTDCNDV